MRDGPGCGPRRLIYLVVLSRRASFRLLALALALSACTSCKLLKRNKGGPDAGAGPAVSGVATASSAALAPTTPPPVVTAPPPPVDPNAMPATERAALEKAKQQLTEIQSLLNHGKDQPKPAESDLKSRCEEIETVRTTVEKRTEADVKPFVDASKQTCSFDVPLYSANNALDQMRFSASQASKLLVCKVAERDIAKARTLKPNHMKVRNTEIRFNSVCRS